MYAQRNRIVSDSLPPSTQILGTSPSRNYSQNTWHIIFDWVFVVYLHANSSYHTHDNTHWIPYRTYTTPHLSAIVRTRSDSKHVFIPGHSP